jgi:hypothetical protein
MEENRFLHLRFQNTPFDLSLVRVLEALQTWPWCPAFSSWSKNLANLVKRERVLFYTRWSQYLMKFFTTPNHQVVSDNATLPSARILSSYFSQNPHYPLWCFLLVIFYPISSTLLLENKSPTVCAIFWFGPHPILKVLDYCNISWIKFVLPCQLMSISGYSLRATKSVKFLQLISSIIPFLLSAHSLDTNLCISI